MYIKIGSELYKFKHCTLPFYPSSTCEPLSITFLNPCFYRLYFHWPPFLSNSKPTYLHSHYITRVSIYLGLLQFLSLYLKIELAKSFETYPVNLIHAPCENPKTKKKYIFYVVIRHIFLFI